MDKTDIIRRFKDLSSTTGQIRGDHDLNPYTKPADDLVPAAVLVPLVNRTDGVTTLLTQRASHLAHHPKQISFPGGHTEPDDGSPEETALRETEEEVGLDRRHVEIVGRLAEYRTRTGFAVTPVVAMVEPPFDISPDPHEVEEVFEGPLAFLMDPANHARHCRKFQGTLRHFHAIPYDSYFIWGATAGMLINLYEVLRDA